MKKTKAMFYFLLASVLIFAPFAFAGQQTGAGERTQSMRQGMEKPYESGMESGYRTGQKTGGYNHHKTGAGMTSKRADQILGKTVVGEDGTNLGTLQDLVIFGKGIVHYGVLNLEGQEDQYVAIPFTFLESREGQESLVLHMDSQKVLEAPTFSLQEITDWDNSEIGQQVHSYYGMEMENGASMMKEHHGQGSPHGSMMEPGTGKAPESGMRDTRQ